MTPGEVDALAARIKALEEVAYAATLFTRHIGGFRLWNEDGQPTDVFTKDIPEALALQRALDALRSSALDADKQALDSV